MIDGAAPMSLPALLLEIETLLRSRRRRWLNRVVSRCGRHRRSDADCNRVSRAAQKAHDTPPLTVGPRFPAFRLGLIRKDYDAGRQEGRLQAVLCACLRLPEPYLDHEQTLIGNRLRTLPPDWA